MNAVIPYGKQEITDEDIAAVVAVLKSDYLTQGPQVAEFEKKFSEFCGSKYAFATNNATSALHISALALGLKPGQKVLCTPNTFVASSNCVLYCGADVEFIDIDPKNYCLDIQLLEEILEKHPPGYYAGLIAVDFAGFPMDFEKLRKICDQYQMWLIEDACHAPGAEFQNSEGSWFKSGNAHFADIATYSFHPVKHIATGEGGMIVTNSDKLAKKIRLLRTHGITKDPSEMARNDGPWFMEMQELGYNHRLPDILCALGTSQLSRIQSNLEKRRALAQKYQEGLKDIPGLQTPWIPDNIKHSFHLYVIQTEKRDQLYAYLKEKNILCQVHYIPIYQQPYYIRKYGKISLSNADAYYRKTLSLPMYHALSESDQERVIQSIRSFFNA